MSYWAEKHKRTLSRTSGRKCAKGKRRAMGAIRQRTSNRDQQTGADRKRDAFGGKTTTNCGDQPIATQETRLATIEETRETPPSIWGRALIRTCVKRNTRHPNLEGIVGGNHDESPGKMKGEVDKYAFMYDMEKGMPAIPCGRATCSPAAPWSPLCLDC